MKLTPQQYLIMRRLATVMQQERDVNHRPFWLECFQHQCRRRMIIEGRRLFATVKPWPPSTGKVTYSRTFAGNPAQ